MPTPLIDAGYSRDFEREAGAAVAACLRARRIPLKRYAGVPGRLRDDLDGKPPGATLPGKNRLSTHPPTG